jgi:hypothetical protein
MINLSGILAANRRKTAGGKMRLAGRLQSPAPTERGDQQRAQHHERTQRNRNDIAGIEGRVSPRNQRISVRAVQCNYGAIVLHQGRTMGKRLPAPFIFIVNQ